MEHRPAIKIMTTATARAILAIANSFLSQRRDDHASVSGISDRNPRRAMAADLTRPESARRRPHPVRVRQQEESVASLSPAPGWSRAIAEVVEPTQPPKHHLPAAWARSILDPVADYRSQASSNNLGHTPAWGSRRIHRSARSSSGRGVAAIGRTRTRSHRCPSLRPSPHSEASP